MTSFTESVVEEATLAWLDALGYSVLHGPDIAAGMPGAERSDPNYRDAVLEGRMRQALVRLNPDLPAEALEDAFRKLTRSDASTLLEHNRADGSIAGAQAKVIDLETPDNNDWLAINQFTVAEGQRTRRPDVVLFVNGLPLAVIELKNPADENATIWSAYQQLQTYQAQIPVLFAPSPIIAAAAIASSTTEQLSGINTRDILSVPLIFREDAFDPVSRTRRGRFYERNPTQPIPWQVYPHPDLKGEDKQANCQGVLSKNLATFHSCAVSQKHFSIVEGQPLVILGYAEQFTIWTVVSNEMSLTGEEIVALRSRASFGALPDTQWVEIPEQGRAQVKRTLEILTEDIYRAGPESVIDRARDAASAILSAYVVDKALADATMDLGRLVGILSKLQRGDKPNICANGGDIIAILHPRAKPSEQARRPLRPIREQDAELAVQLVGTMPCDLGWAQWR